MKTTLFLICIILGTSSVFAETQTLVHILRFNDYETGSEEDWLLSKGFQFKQELSHNMYAFTLMYISTEQKDR